MSKELNKAPVEQAGGDERDFQAEGAQEVPSPVSQEYDRHLISLLRKGEALPGHQEEAADEIERLRDWNDHLNNTVLPNILNPNFLMLMKGGERLLDLCTKDGKFIGVSLNDMKDVFDWMVTHARIAPDHAALAQPSPVPADEKPGDSILCYGCFAKGVGPEHFDEAGKCLARQQTEPLGAEFAQVLSDNLPELLSTGQAEQAEAERPEVVAYADPVAFATFKERGHEGGAAGREWMWAEPGAALVAMSRTDECERIVGALRAENAKLSEALDRWPLIRDSLKLRLADALARVAELEAKLGKLEKQEPVAVVKGDGSLGAGFPSGTKLYAAPVAQPAAWYYDAPSQAEAAIIDIRGMWGEDDCPTYEDVASALRRLLAAEPGNSAQHSVPIAPQLKRALGLVVAALEADGDRPTSKYALSELKKVLAAAPGKEVPQAWIDVQAERRRQVEAEGWTPEHDDLYCAAELPRAAAAYILNGANDEAPAIWPFVAKWWKPRDARSNYVRAGALILAEIERLDRAAPGKEGV